LQRHLTATQILGQELPGLLREVQQDRAGLEQRQRLAAIGWLMIDDGRNAIVRRDLQEVRLELLALADVDRVHVVAQAGLFEKQGNLVAVGRGPVIQVDHGKLQIRKGTDSKRRLQVVLCAFDSLLSDRR